MGLTPRDHTKATLSRMQVSGFSPGNLDRDKDAEGDNYGITAAKSSDASSFKMTGAPKSPHLGRPGRQTGGRISGALQRTRRTAAETASDIAGEDRVANELAKDRATGGRIDRAYGGHADEREDRALVGKMVKPSAMRAKGGRIGRWQGGPNRDALGQKDLYDTLPPDERPKGFGNAGIPDPIIKPFYNFRGGGLGTRSVGAPYEQGGIGSDATATPPRAKGGRVGRSTGGSATAKDEYTQAGRTAGNLDASGKDQWTGGDYAPNHAKGGRVDRARGGRTKGKTTVNVIIGGDKQQPPAMPPPMPPPPMAAPGPVGPPRPPMPPPGMGPGMPPGGAPMGPGGPPPPGGPPMLRARGGRIGRQMGGAMPMAGAPPGLRPGVGVPPPQGMPPQGMPPPGMGAPPPGGMPMRAKGGRIEISTPGVHNFGKPGVKHGAVDEKYGAGGGKGRMEKARRNK